MFISDIVEKIWEPVFQEFKEEYEVCLTKDIQELQNMLRDEKMLYYDYPMTKMNLLVTCGCSHSRKADRFSGCSMCDYLSEGIKATARMAALREKSPKKYAEVVRGSFENVRGKLCEPNVFEYISSFDVLDSKEYPTEVYEELFGKNDLYRRKPAKYVFESRASSVTKDKIDTLKKYVKSNNRITIELGIEVADEWIRNHWLNKDISNKEIIDAVNLLNQEGCKISANVLIGVPGLTEKQSIELFIETIAWLEKLGIHHYNVMPLNRKKRTIQGLLYEKLRNNKGLERLGLVQGCHTGLPWLFTIIEGIYSVISSNPGIVEKISIPQIIESQNSVFNEIAYNSNRKCDCNSKIIRALAAFNEFRDVDGITRVRKSFYNDDCYKDYMLLIQKQKKALNIANTIEVLGEEMAKVLWPNNWQVYQEKLKDEVRLSTIGN